ncbi:hypothetical protein ACVWXU_003409 [Streptomyces sp. TE33382]
MSGKGRGNNSRSNNGRDSWSYRPLDGFTVRLPLLPADSGARLRETSAIDLLSTPMTSLALWIGSDAMWDSLHREGPDSAPSARSVRKARRYIDRMSCRPTPYGLFAGVSLGDWGRATDLAVRRIPDRVETRLDMGWLTALIEQLEADPRILRQLTFTLHPAVFVSAGRLHLVDPLGASGNGSPHCVSLRATGPVTRILGTARGPVSYRRLVETVRSAVPGTADAVCERLIGRLHEAGVLLSSLRPPLTVPDPARYVLHELAGLSDASGRAERLRDLVEQLNRCDAMAPAESLPARRALAVSARELAPDASPPLPPFRTDATADLSGTTLNRAVGREAAKAVELLLRTSPRPDRPPEAVAYRTAFHRRYGTRRRVPLLEVVNPHVGLGLPEDLTATVPADGSAARAERDETLLALAAEALRTGNRTVSLDDRTLERIERRPDPPRLPGTLELVVAVAASSPADIDAGAFGIVVSPIVGGRGGRLHTGALRLPPRGRGGRPDPVLAIRGPRAVPRCHRRRHRVPAPAAPLGQCGGVPARARPRTPGRRRNAAGRSARSPTRRPHRLAGGRRPRRAVGRHRSARTVPLAAHAQSLGRAPRGPLPAADRRDP